MVHNKRDQEILASFNASSASILREVQAQKNLQEATSSELSNAHTYINSLKDWRKRAIACYPRIDELVIATYIKDSADAYCQKYIQLESADPTHENYTKFESALADYYQLSDKVKSLLTISISIIKANRDKALADFIENARMRLIQADTTIVGSSKEDFLALSRVIDWYEKLPDDEEFDDAGSEEILTSE